MKKVLYILNDCMRQFSYEKVASLFHALQEMDEPASLYIVRSDAYSGFAAEHNIGEYNIYRLPDYRDYDCILLDINSIFSQDSGSDGAKGLQYVLRAAAESGKPVISMGNKIDGFYYIDRH